jgi:hypothetical protein
VARCPSRASTGAGVRACGDAAPDDGHDPPAGDVVADHGYDARARRCDDDHDDAPRCERYDDLDDGAGVGDERDHVDDGVAALAVDPAVLDVVDDGAVTRGRAPRGDQAGMSASRRRAS